MKKTMMIVALTLGFSSVSFAADSHTNWQGSVDSFTGTIKNQAQFDDLIKYTDLPTQIKLRAAFKDGELTAQEIKDSGISDHHFYTGLLASAKTQGEYDKYLKQMNDGANMDDKFVSNRDLKAHGSMVMNQVEIGNKVQDARVDKIVAGLKDLGEHIQGGGSGEVTPPPSGGSYDDTAIKESVAEVGKKVDAISGAGGYLDQVGQAFQDQASRTASEITRLDGRIDSLEKKTDKLKAGVAGATAIASLTQYVGNGTHHVAVGIGGYDGASALAGGYTYAFSANTTIRATVALDSEDEIAFGASVGHSW